MEFKKMLIVLSITLCIFTGIMFGVSYGWYAYKNAETNVEGSAIKETPAVIFAQTEYIYSATSQPIYDEDRYNYANKNSFTVTLDENLKDYQVGLKISLNDISMAEELKNANYKYELLEDGISVAFGDFGLIGGKNELDIMPMKIMTPVNYPQSYSYELLIWLSDDGTVQNDLMNKGFRAKVNVVSAVKR